MKIGIIGAGIAGLASAVRLACQGHQVSVYEANAFPGGKLSDFQQDGYRFDLGPSLFTMPQYVEELFELAGEDIHSYFEYQRLSVNCNYFWEDGTQIQADADPNIFARTIEEVLEVPQEKVLKYFKDGQRKYEITGRIFLEQSLHLPETWLQFDVAKSLLRIPFLDLFSSLNTVNERMLSHPKLVQLFNRFATYNGSNPYKVPGLLSMIPHFEHHFGAYIPKGGMVSISRAIYKLAQKLGVSFYFNSPVEKIIVDQKVAQGIQVAGNILPFDGIVSNMDVFFTYKKLLPDQVQPQQVLKQEKSSSALIFYWGINTTFPALDLHNIFFSENYQREFEAIAAGKIYEDPTVYINITQKYCPEDAPKGGENWFTMINVPFNSGQDWDSLIQQSKQTVIDKLSRMLNTNVAQHIVCESVLDPRSIESKTASHLGALYGTSSNNRMAAFMRHANFSNKIANLYFCGGSVHPGGGIPLCLLSAKIVSEVLPKKMLVE